MISIPIKQPDGSMNANRDIPILCKNRVRHVGDAICFIVADSVAIAKDAAELIEIDFNILPAVTDTEKTLEDDSVLVYEDGDKNLAFTHFMGDRKATDQAFAKADQVLVRKSLSIVNIRFVWLLLKNLVVQLNGQVTEVNILSAMRMVVIISSPQKWRWIKMVTSWQLISI